MSLPATDLLLGERDLAGQEPKIASNEPHDSPPPASLNAHEDARALVRLLQCSFCSLLLRTPITLPCGNSLCRDCLPTAHPRTNISYPADEKRQLGITCPFATCHEVHPLSDCSVNVVLLKVMEGTKSLVEEWRQTTVASQINLEEVVQWPARNDIPESMETDIVVVEKGHSMLTDGGRLLATYTFAEAGMLHYTSDVLYESTDMEENESDLDVGLLNLLKETSHKELECHVCYNLMLDPATTPCGHTFCRRCLARILDHSSLCPVCRRKLFMPSSLSNHPNNTYLVNLLSSLCPEQVAARAQAAALEESSVIEGMDTALFVCTLGFPGVQTYLHVFEPRYRLMIRRAMERNGQFGIIGYNGQMESQGHLGRTQFMQVGTMLQIDRLQQTADGRSFLECRGIFRFRVRAHGMLDGYIVGKVEKLEDISLAQEEALEARETSATQPSPSDFDAQLSRMPTNNLLHYGLTFTNRARASSSRWFSSSVLEAYGEPPTDADKFPFWLAAVLPLSEEEKYKMLPLTSVRDRLKLSARWVQRIEAARW